MLLLLNTLAAAAATDLTLYHVNPLHEGVIPLNMDTADLHGDMFFDLQSKTLPIECADKNSPAGDCTNQEVVDNDLVITKLTMQISQPLGTYGRCNACNASDIDPFSRLPCHGSRYLCSCGDYEHPRDCNSQVAVGAENVTENFARFSSYVCTWANWVHTPWLCWGFGVVQKVGTPRTNMWYSHTAAGWCDAEGADPTTCSWSAKVVKVVNKTCSDEAIYSAVEAYDAAHGGSLFAKCAQRHNGRAKRNTSDPCWIYAFYATVLGPAALLPGGDVEGMPVELLDAAFELPFKDTSEGGCPSITPPPPPTAAEEAARTRGRSARKSFGVIGEPSDPKLRAAFLQAARIAVRAQEP